MKVAGSEVKSREQLMLLNNKQLDKIQLKGAPFAPISAHIKNILESVEKVDFVGETSIYN